jgi:hypothetical protein
MKTQRENELLINIRRILVDYYKEGSYTLDKAESDMLNLFASSQQVRKEVVNELREFNPYPESVFIPISDEDMKQFIDYITKYGYSSDAIFGNWGRLVWNNCCDKLSALTDTEGEDKVTDEIIEKWAYLFEESELPFEEQNDGALLRRCKNYVNGLIIGARAMRDKLIKPTKENN